MAAPALALALLAASPSAYERDNEIADVEEPPFRPAMLELATAAAAVSIARVPSEDLIMHCRDESGHWHRLHPSKLQTACGAQFTNWHAGNTRSGRYCDGPLAPCDCWTKSEREEAADRSKPPRVV